MTTPDDRPRSWFSSARERRLWLWSLGVVVAIFLGLWLTPALAGIIEDRALLDASFGLGLLLVGATVVALAMKTRPRGIEIGIALGIAAAYLLVVTRMALEPAERTHLIEYGVLAAFIYEALTERASHGRHVPAPALTALLLTALVGVLDEVLQAFIPGRVFDPLDILFNVLAAGMAIAASALIRWAARWNRSQGLGRRGDDGDRGISD